jgi:fumarate hydratase subunit beta
MKRITTPLTQGQLKALKAGDELFLSGAVFTARDQAHKRLCAALAQGKKLPFALKGQVIYFCGPTQTPKGKVIGSCGPTTSRRMDEFTPALLKNGLAAMIGKGNRSQEVRLALKKYRGVYFLTFAGCGALLSKHVLSVQTIAYPDLGPEAVLKLVVKDFPLIVAIDSKGKNIFQGAI